MNTNCTFPYNYLVTTSFQLKTYRRELKVTADIPGVTAIHLRQAFFQTVTGGLYRTLEPVHRNLADLRLLAIPSSRVSNCRKRSVLRKRLSEILYLVFMNWHLHCSKCVAQLIQAITAWRHPHFHLITWAEEKRKYTLSNHKLQKRIQKAIS